MKMNAYTVYKDVPCTGMLVCVQKEHHLLFECASHSSADMVEDLLRRCGIVRCSHAVSKVLDQSSHVPLVSAQLHLTDRQSAVKYLMQQLNNAYSNHTCLTSQPSPETNSSNCLLPQVLERMECWSSCPGPT